MKRVLLFVTASLWIGACKQTTEKEKELPRETSSLGSAKETEIFIAAGAGYRRPVDELKALYETQTGVTVRCIYGNMKQVTTQVKNSGKVSLVIGDAKFLNKTNIAFKKTADIGRGRLVLAVDKSLRISGVEAIRDAAVQRVVLPDAQKAIYGRAAHETLQKLSLYETVKEKLVVVQTVPQATAYLVSGTAKAGFINKTDFVSLDSKRFASIEVDPSLYTTIMIEAALTQIATDAGDRFFTFLQSSAARDIFVKYGLGFE